MKRPLTAKSAGDADRAEAYRRPRAQSRALPEQESKYDQVHKDYVLYLARPSNQGANRLRRTYGQASDNPSES